MAPRKCPSHTTPIPIGNCEVVVEAKKFTTESNQNSLQISISRNTVIKISVADKTVASSCHGLQRSEIDESGDYLFVLINPKNADGELKALLEEALGIYTKELPAMNYAANTGKESLFLERCVSNGKYSTLLLKSSSKVESGEVIAAITFQIVPADTQYAEVPLAAVKSIYRRKGVGSLLYKELMKRLQNVGITTLFCWGDKLSEGFWIKQGFVSIGEVDSKGRARKLPIKADVRKALCFPGGSTLMVSYLNNSSEYSTETLKLSFTAKSLEKFVPSVFQENGFGGVTECVHSPNVVDLICTELRTHQSENSAKERFMVNGIGGDSQARQCSCSTIGSKRKLWEASYTSLKSKKVKGHHPADCTLDLENDGRICFCEASFNTVSRSKSPVYYTAHDPLSTDYLEKNTVESNAVNFSSEDSYKKHPSTFRIMLMNIADDTKKSSLTEIIEGLGGSVTMEGNACTHVITGKVRRTLNFCTALCSGAWIITAIWLKESFRVGKFVDEMPFILKDEDYELKYRTDLRSTVLRAKEHPGALLRGHDVCLAANVQPSVSTLSATIRSAGGNVIHGLNKANESPKTIFIASEENMEEALSAVKKGMQTFGTEWFMNCVMRQELDLNAPQFAESL